MARGRCRYFFSPAAAALPGALAIWAAAPAPAAPPTFTGLGVLPGGSDSGALAVSPNGAFVVGYNTVPAGERAFRWSRASGMQTLGVLPGGTDSRAVGVSADGLVVVGYSNSPAGSRAFRWTAAGGMKDLGTFAGGSNAVASGVSADGSVVVGYSDTGSGQSLVTRAFRWTAAGGLENLGTVDGGTSSYGAGVSADGTVIAGVGDTAGSFDFRAFRMVYGQAPVNLGTVPGGAYSVAFGISADGSAVVGYGRVDHDITAFRWSVGEGMINIGRFPGSGLTVARAASNDGRIVVGSDEGVTGDAAFIWTSDLGMVNLNTYLLARGLQLPGWTLTSATGISADGLTIVGIGEHAGRLEGWVAFLGSGQDLTAIEQLGKSIMSDTSLSSPAGQSCISCHAAAAGFTNPRSSDNEHGAVHRGAVPGRFGNRRPPTAAYAGDSPPLHLEDGTWVGGMFFDGHAPGWTLGDPLAEQAMFPFLNPLEQNNAGLEDVVAKVAASGYAPLFRDVWGEDSLPTSGDGAGAAYERIVRSIAAYERSREVSPFNSRYDDFLAGRSELTRQESRGLALFNGVARCAQCHPSAPGPNGEPPLFTDFTYDNVGTPANPENPFYAMGGETNPDGPEFIDLGLGGFLQEAGFPASVYGPEMGKHKVPTLRNVDRRPEAGFTRSYAHNGYFKSLEEIVHFYNTRDVEPWPPPEVPQNVNTAELGNLHLTADEEADLVAFLRTLTDRDTTPVHCPADFDHNGFVNGADYDAFVIAFEFGAATADVDRNGFVDGSDFDLFTLAFVAGC